MIWTEESAALLWRAYREGTAKQTLADRITPEIKPDARICDAGCGVGALSLEMAQRGFCVTALDISPVALGQLPAHARIEALCEDAEKHEPEAPYDAMVFCFFGDMPICLRMAARCCTGDMFYISRDYDMHRFSVGQHPVRYSGYRQARDLLDKMAIPYQAEECALDMGQPFRDREEARRFFMLYSRDDPAMITDTFLESKLTHTQSSEYPLYLPHMRRCGMVHVQMKDIPQALAGTE